MGDRQRLHFIGVTTGGSRIMDLFPVWADVLGLDAEMAGRDVEIGAPAERYREVVSEIAQTPQSRGALVTTHKVGVLEHAGDLFAELDPYARLCGEISCISKRASDDALIGHAKDPITAGQSLDAMLEADHWDRYADAEVLCMGAGGAGTAIVVRLLTEDPSPAGITVTDRDRTRADALAGVVDEVRDGGGAGPAVRIEPVEGAADHDALLDELPAGSLVVNATGMGKDIPGSPISDGARFPDHGVVWELNYRGERPFLRQARDQAERRSLAVHDGWRYFLHGWTEVIAEVFRIDLTPARFDELAAAAEPFRP